MTFDDIHNIFLHRKFTVLVFISLKHHFAQFQIKSVAKMIKTDLLDIFLLNPALILFCGVMENGYNEYLLYQLGIQLHTSKGDEFFTL